MPAIEELVAEVLLVGEDEIEAAMTRLLETEKIVAEGAGAAALAAVLAHPHRFTGRKVGVIVSGGNVDMRLLSSVILRGLAATAASPAYASPSPTSPASWPRSPS